MLEAAGGVDLVALAEVQDKASARLLSVPLRQAGRRYILKLDPPDARVVHDATGTPGLLVERFDRLAGPDGSTVSVAVEDGAQVLGVYPADKYAVAAEDVAAALAGVCPASAVALRDVFRQLCFAWLTGKGDLHAKNLSVVAVDGEWRVAPAYDLPSTLPYRITPWRWRWEARPPARRGGSCSTSRPASAWPNAPRRGPWTRSRGHRTGGRGVAGGRGPLHGGGRP